MYSCQVCYDLTVPAIIDLNRN